MDAGDTVVDEGFTADIQLNPMLATAGGGLDQRIGTTVAPTSENHTTSSMFGPNAIHGGSYPHPFHDVGAYGNQTALEVSGHIQGPLQEHPLPSPLLPSPAPTRGSSPNSRAAHQINAANGGMRSSGYNATGPGSSRHQPQLVHIHTHHQVHPHAPHLGDHQVCQYHLQHAVNPIPPMDYPYGYYPDDTLNPYAFGTAAPSAMEGGISGSQLMLAGQTSTAAPAAALGPMALGHNKDSRSDGNGLAGGTSADDDMGSEGLAIAAPAAEPHLQRRKSDASLKAPPVQKKKGGRRPSMAKSDLGSVDPATAGVAGLRIGQQDADGEIESADAGVKGEKKRRRQVKVACTHCKKACKKCDDMRPCTRCVRLNLGPCFDAPRKERRKGFKRGPYKKDRKEGGAKGGSSTSESGSDSEDVDGKSPRPSTPNKEGKERRGSLVSGVVPLGGLLSNVHGSVPLPAANVGAPRGLVGVPNSIVNSGGVGMVNAEGVGLFVSPMSVYSPSATTINFAG
ncbi:hypothetical protein HDU96_004012 [Phlyctochytrium bullatum]|nr:hypothetical protein HDU96_004012 [Phlyctochytrium bullatum]